MAYAYTYVCLAAFLVANTALLQMMHPAEYLCTCTTVALVLSSSTLSAYPIEEAAIRADRLYNKPDTLLDRDKDFFENGAVAKHEDPPWKDSEGGDVKKPAPEAKPVPDHDGDEDEEAGETVLKQIGEMEKEQLINTLGSTKKDDFEEKTENSVLDKSETLADAHDQKPTDK